MHDICRLQFLRACYGKLVIPNVHKDFKWTGEAVKINCGQGTFTWGPYTLCWKLLVGCGAEYDDLKLRVRAQLQLLIQVCVCVYVCVCVCVMSCDVMCVCTELAVHLTVTANVRFWSNWPMREENWYDHMILLLLINPSFEWSGRLSSDLQSIVTSWAPNPRFGGLILTWALLLWLLSMTLSPLHS